MVQDNTIIHSYKWGYQGIKRLNDFPKFIQLVSANQDSNLGSLAADPVFLILDQPHFALQILFLIQCILSGWNLYPSIYPFNYLDLKRANVFILSFSHPHTVGYKVPLNNLIEVRRQTYKQ